VIPVLETTVVLAIVLAVIVAVVLVVAVMVVVIRRSIKDSVIRVSYIRGGNPKITEIKMWPAN
jgi:uncharacterized protein (DUF2062 family)